MPNKTELYTFAEARRELGVTVRFLRHLLTTNALKADFQEGRVFITEESIRAWKAIPEAERAAKRSSFLKKIGPGVITGAADDDPSGIGTYSTVGARFGLGLSWLALYLLPLMTAVQETCARIGIVTGSGVRPLEHEALPAFLANQRWFGGKDGAIERTHLGGVVQLPDSDAPAWGMSVTTEAGETHPQYAMPPAIAVGRRPPPPPDDQPRPNAANHERPPGTLHHGVMYGTLGRDGSAAIRHVHRKNFLPTYGMFDEQRFVERGDGVRACEPPSGRAAMPGCGAAGRATPGLTGGRSGGGGVQERGRGRWGMRRPHRGTGDVRADPRFRHRLRAMPYSIGQAQR